MGQVQRRLPSARRDGAAVGAEGQLLLCEPTFLAPEDERQTSLGRAVAAD